MRREPRRGDTKTNLSPASRTLISRLSLIRGLRQGLPYAGASRLNRCHLTIKLQLTIMRIKKRGGLRRPPLQNLFGCDVNLREHSFDYLKAGLKSSR